MHRLIKENLAMLLVISAPALVVHFWMSNEEASTKNLRIMFENGQITATTKQLIITNDTLFGLVSGSDTYKITWRQYGDRVCMGATRPRRPSGWVLNTFGFGNCKIAVQNKSAL
jgi:hypothetical protein